MGKSERWETGYETIQKVYAGEIAIPPEGNVPFLDLMLKQLFAEVWTREELSRRDRRLLVMGVIAGMGESMPWGVQVKAALKNGELTPAQVRETLIQLVQYAGYPRVAGLVGATERAIAEVEKEAAGS